VKFLDVIAGKHAKATTEVSDGPWWRFVERPEPHKVPMVRVGDRIRISVAMLRHLYESPEHISFQVEVAEIINEDDGTKTLMLKHLI